MKAGNGRPLGPPNAQAETPAQGATPKPKPTRSGDLNVCTQLTPQPPPIPHSLIDNHLSYRNFAFKIFYFCGRVCNVKNI
ncbi:hypothetical protein HanIR_Chr15g0759271 [Helianthus annuus]|nr:hypothetical protein HanIR_Chr15g0759271 [Helianthus annuus]